MKNVIYYHSSENMYELNDNSVALIVTSPPYPKIYHWENKSYFKCKTYDEMHQYLSKIWEECYRILINGGMLAINIGDACFKENNQFQLFSNHATIIENCRKLHFTTLPFIIWKKDTNKPNSFLGSGMLPTNAYITLGCEFILLFRKGNIRKFKPKDVNRYNSKYTFEERNQWFQQYWNIPGARQKGKGYCTFPEEIPKRLIKMFSVINDIVVDPFVGTGTTIKVANEVNRIGIGYEIDNSIPSVI